jgi:predicted dehydrogenase
MTTMTMDGQLKVAIVGMGLIGNRHAWAYERHPRVDIVAVCDDDPERARRAAERFGCAGYTSFDDIAARDDVDLVSVCTPDPFHVAPVLAMLRSGKHVLCEKPLTLDYVEAKMLVDEAARQNRHLSVRLPQRYVADHRRLRGMIGRGQLGILVSGNLRSLIPITMPTTLAWAARTDLHWLYHQHRYDLVRWLTGLEAVDVFARGTRGVLASRGIDCHDSVQVIVTYQNGASIVYDTSWINPPGWRRGGITLDLLFANGRVSTAAEPSLTVALLETGDQSGAAPGIVPDSVGAGGELPENQWRPVQEVADAILRGESPPVSAADALAVMAILQATDDSLRTGNLVSIRQVVESGVPSAIGDA